MATVKDLLTLASRQIGTCESPPDSNNVRYNTWYYGREVSGSAYPWCMVFVQWVFDRMKVSLPLRTASCSSLMWKAQERGMWVENNFRPGDIVIYDFTGKRKTASHCGIVEEVLPDYGVRAVEGNTSAAGSQSNGGMVCRKDRHSKYIMGAVRPVFEEEEDIMTGKEIYNAIQDYLSKEPLPAWAAAELEEAKALGITDGENPMQLIPRYQAAIMAKRAAQGK